MFTISLFHYVAGQTWTAGQIQVAGEIRALG
jgi:hypothetical protein